MATALSYISVSGNRETQMQPSFTPLPPFRTCGQEASIFGGEVEKMRLENIEAFSKGRIGIHLMAISKCTVKSRSYFPIKFLDQPFSLFEDTQLDSTCQAQRKELLRLGHNVNILTLSIIPSRPQISQTFYQGKRYFEEPFAKKLLEQGKSLEGLVMNHSDNKTSKVERLVASSRHGPLERDEDRTIHLRGFIAPWADFESTYCVPAKSYQNAIDSFSTFDSRNLENNISGIQTEGLRDQLLKLLAVFREDHEAKAIGLILLDHKDSQAPIKSYNLIKK